MKVRSAALAIAAVSLFSASAAHAAGPITARLQTPVEGRVKQIAGGAAFVCEGDACTAASPGSSSLTVMACRELVRAVGPVTAYGSQSKQLDADKLGACNAWAKAKPSSAN